MPIAKKTKPLGKITNAAKKSSVPRITAKETGIPGASLARLHALIEQRKQINDQWDTDEVKGDLLDFMRNSYIENGGNHASIYVDLPVKKGDSTQKSLLVMVQSKPRAMNPLVAEAIEEIIENAGHDAGDYYHESQVITVDADTIYERLGEKKYAAFQADLAEFMADRGLGDCWENKCKITPRKEFAEKRFALPTEVNYNIEAKHPSIVSVVAKRSLAS